MQQISFLVSTFCFFFLSTYFSKIGLIPLRVMSETREIANIYIDPYETWAAWFSETAATFPHVAPHGSSHKPLCGTPGSRPWQIYVQICPPISGGWFPSLRDREGSPARRKQTGWERAAARDKRWTRDAESTDGMEAEQTIFLTLKRVFFSFFLFHMKCSRGGFSLQTAHEERRRQWRRGLLCKNSACVHPCNPHAKTL